MKKQCTEWETMFASHSSDRGLVYEKHKELKNP